MGNSYKGLLQVSDGEDDLSGIFSITFFLLLVLVGKLSRGTASLFLNDLGTRLIYVTGYRYNDNL
ncbi:MAG: hypothetical protein JNJ77_16060 [Planctomycetia bacterium]|nr:hypothetical protein [Planctomycetia bacterium]